MPPVCRAKFCERQNGLVIACGQHALRFWNSNVKGGRRLSVREFLAGANLKTGQRLG